MLAERYGNVYSLYLGRKPAVVLNGLKAMKEALVAKSVDFSGRPQNLLVSHLNEGKGVILADYGPGWKEHRRFALMTLRNFGMGKYSMENRILGEIEHLISELENYAGSFMDPQTLFHNAASNIIYLILFGLRFDYGSETLNQYVKLFKESTKIVNGPWGMIYDTLPFVRSWPLPFRKVFKNNDLLKEMTIGMINKHKNTRIPGQPRNFVDCYLDELETRGFGSSFDEEQLVMYVLNLHSAGTDTTSNTLLTAFLYLTAYPEFQEKCQQEIDEFLEGKAQVSFEDRHNMPYTQALIHESQRIANITPLSVFHSTTRDTELMGYSIPRGTIIIPHLSSVLSEKGQWKFPHEFNLLNFLNDQGQFEKPEAFIPFSA
ncbi:cytochrome P450 2F2-like, partial [Clarias magur]